MSGQASNPLKTRGWLKARAECFAIRGRVCYWCGHDGATDVDHIAPKSRGGALYDVANLAPVHGVGKRRCSTCGRQCNREKSDKPLAEVIGVQASRDWYVG